MANKDTAKNTADKTAGKTANKTDAADTDAPGTTTAEKPARTVPSLPARLLARIRRGRGPLVTVLRLSGVIRPPAGPGRSGLAIEQLAQPIAAAFRPAGVQAVALVINSPGGSAAQSALIATRIRRLADEKNIPVYGFIEDAAASGGYWLACAADEIIAVPASIVGSIGVISAGFGFAEALQKLGIERRVHTIGRQKAILDPFQPEKNADVQRLKTIQAALHREFVAWVEERRGPRLNPAEPLFEGAFWTGRRALELGLIDGIGDMHGVLRARFGDNLRLRPVNRPPGRLRGLLGMSAALSPAFGTDSDAPAWPDGIGEGLIAAAEERLYRQRLGL